MNTCLWIAWLLLRMLLVAIIRLKWLLTGVSSRPAGKPVRVMNIAFKLQWFELGPSVPVNFTCDHESWQDTSVLLSPTVTLYGVNKSFAYFVDTECSRQVLAQDHPFYFCAQFKRAKWLLEVPLEDFHRFTDQLPAFDSSKLMYLFSTGRCGSTLISQCLNEVPLCLSMSEPDSYTTVALNDWPVESKERLLVSIIKTEALAFGADCEYVCVKMRSQCTVIADIVHKVFPKLCLTFMYRNAIETTFSQIRTFGDMPFLNILLREDRPQWLKNMVRKVIMGKLNLPLSEFQLSNPQPSPIELCTAMWIQQFEVYEKLRQQGVTILGIRYEDLVHNSRPFLRALLDVMQIKYNNDLLDRAVKCLETDSQGGSSISTAARGQARKFTDADKAKVVEVLQMHKKFRAPEHILDGTLLH